ncbi:amino acid permease [Salix suchowensis]|nr:amino acid permease [Salix suchowensis]
MAVKHELENSLLLDDDGRARTGTLWSCIAHIITAVIGSGVLSLAWSVAQLGWIAGPVAMLCFSIVTYFSVVLLSDCYRYPDPVTGTRNYSYMDVLGQTQTWLCGLFQYLFMYGICTAYVITTRHAIRRSNCYHESGHNAKCEYEDTPYMMIFGAHKMAFSLAAIMSFAYSLTGFGLGLATVIGRNGMIKGSLTGAPAATRAKKLWLVFEALGDIAYAYPYALILLEIQKLLNEGYFEVTSTENKTMKKASMVAIFLTTLFYLLCGCFGYAAFGNNTPGNLLTGLGFYEPYWLIGFANACIVLHLVGGYQLFSQPVFTFVERWSSKKFPRSGFLNNFYSIKLHCCFFPHLSFQDLFSNCICFVNNSDCTVFPYFNQVLGLLGAFNFWPLAIYFPVEMYFVRNKVEAWTRNGLFSEHLASFAFLYQL